MDKYTSTSTIYINGRQGYEVRSGSSQDKGQGEGQGQASQKIGSYGMCNSEYDCAYEYREGGQPKSAH